MYMSRRLQQRELAQTKHRQTKRGHTQTERGLRGGGGGEACDSRRMWHENAHRRPYDTDKGGFHRTVTWDAPQTGQWEHGSDKEGDQESGTHQMCSERAQPAQVRMSTMKAPAKEGGDAPNRGASVSDIDSEQTRGEMNPRSGGGEVPNMQQARWHHYIAGCPTD